MMMQSPARDWIERHVERLEPLHREASLAQWTASISGRSEDYERAASLQVELRRLYSDAGEFSEIRRLRESDAAGDPLLRRQIELLYLEYLANQIPQEILEPMVRKSMEAENVFNTFRATIDGREFTENEIRDVLRRERNSEDRRAAWEASKRVGMAVSGLVREVARLRNRAAHHLGFDNFYAMSIALQEQELRELRSLFDDLAASTLQPFRQVKSEIDAALSARFEVCAEALMPWHYSDPFFQDAPRVVEYDLDSPFRGRDVVALSREFYRGIGLPVDDLLERSDLYEKKGKEQHAYCIDIDRLGDVRVLANVRDNEQWMGTMLHELGHASYDRNINRDLPFMLRTAAHTLTTEAVAMFFGRRSRCEELARHLLGLDETEARHFGEAGRRMLRYDLLVFSRWVQVVVRFEQALYEDPERDLNGVWWDLVEHYQGLRRPERRDGADWASKIHVVSHPVYYHNYMLGEILASQLQRTLAEHIGDGDTAPGDWRAFVNEPRAGSFLKERLLRHGARLHWRELVVEVTGESLSSDYFAVQFMTASG